MLAALLWIDCLQLNRSSCAGPPTSCSWGELAGAGGDGEEGEALRAEAALDECCRHAEDLGSQFYPSETRYCSIGGDGNGYCSEIQESCMGPLDLQQCHLLSSSAGSTRSHAEWCPVPPCMPPHTQLLNLPAPAPAPPVFLQLPLGARAAAAGAGGGGHLAAPDGAAAGHRPRRACYGELALSPSLLPPVFPAPFPPFMLPAPWLPPPERKCVASPVLNAVLPTCTTGPDLRGVLRGGGAHLRDPAQVSQRGISPRLPVFQGMPFIASKAHRARSRRLAGSYLGLRMPCRLWLPFLPFQLRVPL